MIVCSKCGYPLSEAVENDPPKVCPQKRCPKAKWIDYEVYQAKRTAEIAKTQPAPQPLPEGFGGNVITDEVSPYFDWGIGQKITSKSQRKALCAQMGLIEKSTEEHYRNREKPFQGRAVRSYKGKKDRETPVTGVRTATGQLVL